MDPPPPRSILGVATRHHREFPVATLVAAKAGRRVSVVLPARDEEATVGPIVAAVRERLAEEVSLVDEIVVVDTDSTDDTAVRAAAAGAKVFAAGELCPEAGPPLGKGDALWRSLSAATGDVIVWIDADITDFDCRFVTGVLGPVLTDERVQLAKGFYERPITGDGGVLAPSGGGRVTELVARPLVALVCPELAGVVQPLSGEYAIRRDTAERLPFAAGYGVEIGLLVDVFRAHGLAAVVQVDLERRVHRNRPLDALGPTAFEVAHTLLRRARRGFVVADEFRRVVADLSVEDVLVHTLDRPPLAEFRSRL